MDNELVPNMNISANSTNPLKPNVLTEFIIYGVFLNIISILGIAGNGLGVLVLSRFTKSPFNLLLISLSLSDLGVCLFHSLFVGVPVFLSYLNISCSWDSENVWSGGIIAWLFNLAYFASIMFTLVISMERFLAVSWPFHAAQWFTMTTTKILICSVALFTVCVKLPMLVLYMATEENPALVTAVNILDVTFEFAIPLPLVVVVNCIVIYKIRRQANLGSSGSGERASKATKILLGIVSIYIPNIILGGLVFHFTLNYPELDNTPTSYSLLATFRLLLTINSASNFVIYCVFGRDFRQAVGNCCRKGNTGETTTTAAQSNPTKVASSQDGGV
ncbi:FMRFamide receptor isoform X2 [Folsomia candida]|uniref:FMRFamide receptor n=1 Tax=Folsomia candida TaxID=158441 RepID=A0A226ELK0_FOLCA|nr:FMRFamide receptor isoform X2 [Folsomia candida]OXA57874.1 FMRFamide receptor [Folsomia candida]